MSKRSQSGSMCRHYLNGTCTYGVLCKYSHGGEGHSNTPEMCSQTSTSNSNEAAGFAAQAAAVGSVDAANLYFRNIPPRFAASNIPNLPHTVTSGAETKQQVERENIPHLLHPFFIGLLSRIESDLGGPREIERPQNRNNTVPRTWPPPLSPDNQQGRSPTTTTGTWVDPSEFPPKVSVKPKSYAEVLCTPKPSSEEHLGVSKHAFKSSIKDNERGLELAFAMARSEDKNTLIKSKQKACKYFKQGRGKCPFGKKCLYLHGLPDGTKTDAGPPSPHQQDVLQMPRLPQIILWDFLDDRDNHWLYSLADDLEDLVSFFSDSDESEWSEYKLFLE